ncbi:N-carbamoylputrescine amidase [Candidatus Endolissoclinum faulkneri L5]|uniref:N-carbamoylputrescine amidase n=1 Tax=Candidatus Endolissoclinum faulkneri L5 TaxID=1401328 RepID=V9TSE8_9PROT|nr:N-carbamoylputrescine amidase [Candidatus Endolissoclinum faulkneri]AHC73824.1 N-carbamoylputrescine amidase [Candidatus Endolissoclinum faulkneri L5]
MSRIVTVAATQMSCCDNYADNLDRAEEMIRRAVKEGAQIVLLQELFEMPYFCKDQDGSYFSLARPLKDNKVIARFSSIARELSVVLPFSFFEESYNTHFNSLVMIDADGSVLDLYRKSHIPDGPGYQEKFYFTPGDTGLLVWDTIYGRLGCAICWDQWFPEVARVMALQGAELLLYPSAIGNEPMTNSQVNNPDHWRRVMQGHAGANLIPLIVSNRVGIETGHTLDLTFYGTSFITDATGAVIADAKQKEGAVILGTFNLDELRLERIKWGIFRDRRPQLYSVITAKNIFSENKSTKKTFSK